MTQQTVSPEELRLLLSEDSVDAPKAEEEPNSFSASKDNALEIALQQIDRLSAACQALTERVEQLEKAGQSTMPPEEDEKEEAPHIWIPRSQRHKHKLR